MRRRAFLGLLGGAAAVPLLPAWARAEPRKRNLPRNYVPFDARPYIHPTYLRAEDVDPLIWPAVQRINQSGWVWTLESCQGHRGPRAWCDKPLLRLAAPSGDLDRMLAELVRATPIPRTYGGEQVPLQPEQTRLEIFRHVEAPMPGWAELRVMVHGPHGITVFDRFAEAVNQEN